MKQRRERVERALSGFVVIVVGVLVALWADAAWAERNDRTREKELLADLLQEFHENRALLNDDIRRSVDSRAAGGSWAEAMFGRADLEPDSVAALWSTAQNWGRFDPVTGALRSVLDGGELRLIRSQELRIALAGWTDRAEEARFTSRSMITALAGATPTALAAQPGAPHTVGQLAAINLVAGYSGGSLDQLRPLRDDLDEIVALIEREIGR